MSSSDPIFPRQLPSFRRARPLLFSNTLDAAGRQGVDFATDVLAVVVLGASSAQMGLLNAIGTLAFLVLGIPIGVLVDRSPTVRLLAVSGLVRAVVVTTVVAAWALDSLTIGHLYLVAGLVGITTVVTETGQTAITPRIAAQDAVAPLVSRMQSAESVVGLAAPALAGLAVAAVGAGPTLSVATALIALAALVVLRLRIGAHNATGEEKEPAVPIGALTRLLSEAKEGWTVLRHNSVLWRLTLASMLVNLGLAAHSAIEVVLILRTLELGTETLGLILSAASLGALIGSVLAVSLTSTFRTATVLWASMLSLSPISALTLLALVDTQRATLWLATSTFLWGLTIVVYNITNAGLSARITPTRLMGRVSATRRTLAMGVIPAGSLAGGFAADHFGMGYAIAIWTILNATAAALLLLTPIKSNTR